MEVSFMGFTFINILIYLVSTAKHTTCTNGKLFLFNTVFAMISFMSV
jgi:hypothetical protein